jgi:5'-3' exonuclease
VIKEVPVDKVVFRDIPVEVVKKEIIHTPIYTNDPDLLKFGTSKVSDILKDDDDDDDDKKGS